MLPKACLTANVSRCVEDGVAFLCETALLLMDSLAEFRFEMVSSMK